MKFSYRTNFILNKYIEIIHQEGEKMEGKSKREDNSVNKEDIVYIDDDTIYIKGIGYGKSTGKPNMKKLVKLLLKSKYITG